MLVSCRIKSHHGFVSISLREVSINLCCAAMEELHADYAIMIYKRGPESKTWLRHTLKELSLLRNSPVITFHCDIAIAETSSLIECIPDKVDDTDSNSFPTPKGQVENSLGPH